jgi:hypothetical protein
MHSNTTLRSFNQGIAFVTFYYYADAITALDAKISIDCQRLVRISIPRDNKKTPQTAMVDKVEKKPRQEFARQNTKALNSSQKGSSSKVTLFLTSYILLKYTCYSYNVSLLHHLDCDFIL